MLPHGANASKTLLPRPRPRSTACRVTSEEPLSRPTMPLNGRLLVDGETRLARRPGGTRTAVENGSPT